MRLLCFPYAGGGSSAFRGWSNALPRQVEVCAVQLPGRETRLREPAVRKLPELIALLRSETAPLREGRYAFFGHSLGALVAFELTRELRRRGERLPVRLVVSGCRAPHTHRSDITFGDLDDRTLIARLREFAGTPEAVLRDPELLALVLPTLRADFGLRDGYRCLDEPSLPIPITALGGEQDTYVPLSALSAWRSHTQCEFTVQTFPGGHFYFREQPAFYDALANSLGESARQATWSCA